MENLNAYVILMVYGILAVITAAIGQRIRPGEGLTYGYLVGLVLSVLLWYGYGKNKFGPK